MPHPNVTAIFPSFENPNHFDRLRGRYVCILCRDADGSQRTFNTEKAALAHERSTDHTYSTELEKNNPWNAEPGADSAGWGSEPANDHQQIMSTEEVKDKEQRKRVSELPGAIEKWRSGFREFLRDGEMLPVDRPPTSKRKSRRAKAAKNANTPNENKVTQTSENAPSGVQQSHSIATSSIGGRDTSSTQIAPGSHVRDNSKCTGPSKPAVHPAPVQMRPAHTKIVRTSPPTELTPELREWMAKMVIEMRFSPTRARQMREFIQLPTDTKVDMIQHSAWDLRGILFA